MKALNKDAQNLRTIYSENDVDRIENEILRSGEGSGSGSGSGSSSGSGSDPAGTRITISAGSDSVDVGDPIVFTVNLSWTNGQIVSEHCTAYVNATIDLKYLPEEYEYDRVQVDVNFIGYFGISIAGECRYYNIKKDPGRKRPLIEGLIGSYTIPEDYIHGLDDGDE